VHAVSNGDKRTPWHEAAAAGHVEFLARLMEVLKDGEMSDTTGNILNQDDGQGQTPLMLACKGKSDRAEDNCGTAGSTVHVCFMF
jgi:ankyrin repeat protein